MTSTIAAIVAIAVVVYAVTVPVAVYLAARMGADNLTARMCGFFWPVTVTPAILLVGLGAAIDKGLRAASKALDHLAWLGRAKRQQKRILRAKVRRRGRK